MKEVYRIPCEMVYKGYQTVDANSYEEAVQFMLDHEKSLNAPTIMEPIEGSLMVKGEAKYGKNAKAIADMHERSGVNILPRETAVNRTMFSDTITKL